MIKNAGIWLEKQPGQLWLSLQPTVIWITKQPIVTVPRRSKHLNAYEAAKFNGYDIRNIYK